MAEGGLTILDGALLREADLSLPSQPPATVITAAEVLKLAETRASLSLYGVVLPETLKSSALRRLGFPDAAAFRTKALDCADAPSTFRNYISAIADELKDDPVVVAILNGSTIQIFLEDEDDFAMIAENLFTELDTEDRGKICRDEIKSSLVHMGVESGVPPVSEFAELSDILKKHGAEGKEELGQAQFAELLQSVLQELADSLAKNPVVIVQPIKVVNGSKLRQLTVNEKLLEDVVKKINSESKIEESSTSKIRNFLEKHGFEIGLPPSELDEVAILLDAVFTEVDSQNDAAEIEKDGVVVLLKKILEKLAEKLETNPIFYDLQFLESKEV
ncbi:hypothetical protein ACP275_14G188200 [Erythranthe tilingii]